MSSLTDASRMSRSPRCDGEPTADDRPAAAPAQLDGCVRRVAELEPREREQMRALLQRYFEDVAPARFAADLDEKEWAVLLRDRAGQLQGFSTLMRLRASVDGRPVVGFFSGDTIIDREHWGGTALPRLWAQHVFALAAEVREARVFWFLISSGYKTYRFLPTFFRTFYPAYSAPTPPEMQRTLDALALLKFPDEYDPARGVVRLAQATPLRAGVADLTPERRGDPHVAFFAAANPGHADGDELACLTEIAPSNLTPAGRRMLGLGRCAT